MTELKLTPIAGLEGWSHDSDWRFFFNGKYVGNLHIESGNDERHRWTVTHRYGQQLVEAIGKLTIAPSKDARECALNIFSPESTQRVIDGVKPTDNATQHIQQLLDAQTVPLLKRIDELTTNLVERVAKYVEDYGTWEGLHAQAARMGKKARYVVADAIRKQFKTEQKLGIKQNG